VSGQRYACVAEARISFVVVGDAARDTALRATTRSRPIHHAPSSNSREHARRHPHRDARQRGRADHHEVIALERHRDRSAEHPQAMRGLFEPDRADRAGHGVRGNDEVTRSRPVRAPRDAPRRTLASSGPTSAAVHLYRRPRSDASSRASPTPHRPARCTRHRDGSAADDHRRRRALGMRRAR
jgi:hypothetical protein